MSLSLFNLALYFTLVLSLFYLFIYFFLRSLLLCCSLQALLQLNPSRRISAMNAQQYPFMSSLAADAARSNSQSPFGNATLSSMQSHIVTPEEAHTGADSTSSMLESSSSSSSSSLSSSSMVSASHHGFVPLGGPMVTAEAAAATAAVAGDRFQEKQQQQHDNFHCNSAASAGKLDLATSERSNLSHQYDGTEDAARAMPLVSEQKARVNMLEEPSGRSVATVTAEGAVGMDMDITTTTSTTTSSTTASTSTSTEAAVTDTSSALDISEATRASKVRDMKNKRKVKCDEDLLTMDQSALPTAARTVESALESLPGQELATSIGRPSKARRAGSFTDASSSVSVSEVDASTTTAAATIVSAAAAAASIEKSLRVDPKNDFEMRYLAEAAAVVGKKRVAKTVR